MASSCLHRLRWQTLVCAVAVIFHLKPASAQTAGTNLTGPLSTFLSRPDLAAPFLNVTLHNDSYVTPGYIFLAPYQTSQPGPYLYDNTGNLVWSGFGPTGAGPSHDFHLCQYGGSDHFCFFTGQQYLGYARGHGVIMDMSFNFVASVQSQAGYVPSDQHEFNVINGGKSALVTIYQPTPYDLSAYGITGGQGWILNCWAQEIEVGTNKVLFEWSALDHVDPSYSFVAANSTEVSGTGLNQTAGWDYFHMNSIDKNSDGDYLISSRHTSTIYKVSGKDRSIIWRLGGMSSDFTLAGGFNFSSQHDARFISENDTMTIISLFDNASNGYNQSASYSSGMIAALNLKTKYATLLCQYICPEDMISSSQGNLQILDNGNAYLGWGSNAYISEHTVDGNPVLQAHFATTGALHYRSYKYNVTTKPTDSPTAYIYAHNNTAPTIYYMSWNGATEVAKWRIYTSGDPTKPFSLLATTNKNGFETMYTNQDFQQWSIIEAVASDGSGLANSSSYMETFVPGATLAQSCLDTQCPMAMDYSSQPSVVVAQHSGSPTVTDNAPSATVLAAQHSGSPTVTDNAPIATTSKKAVAVRLVRRWWVMGLGVVAAGLWAL